MTKNRRMTAENLYNAIRQNTDARVRQIDCYRIDIDGVQVFIREGLCRIYREDYAFRFKTPYGVLDALIARRVLKKISREQYFKIIALCTQKQFNHN